MKQNKSIVIGLTGGIATGKSTVTKILRAKGFPVIDADEISREVVKAGKPAYKEIVDKFGQEILNTDKSINRSKLGEIIFNDESKRLLLNSIVHPKVSDEIKYFIEKNKKDYHIVFADIPLLIEERAKLNSQGLTFDEIWLVYTNPETQINRLMSRDNISRDKALSRINAQMAIEEKKKAADKIIDNSGNIEYLERNIDKLLENM